MSQVELDAYLHKSERFIVFTHLLPRPKTLFLKRYYFHRRVCVCVCVCHSIISKSSQSIFMKLGRMVYDDKISVPFEDEINRSVEEHTLPKRMVKKGGK